jgi:ketosteroid isomerase-like protein
MPDRLSATFADFFFADKRGSICFDLRDLAVTASADVAFVTCVVHCEGTSGEVFDLQLTIGLRRADGQWRVIHGQHSGPSTAERFADPQAAPP